MIIALCLIFVIVATTVITSCVPIMFNSQLDRSYKYITVYNGKGQYQDFYQSNNEGAVVCEKLEKAFDESFTDTVLSTLFQGALSFKQEVKREGLTSETMREMLENKIYIVFNYNDSKTFNYNGKIYQDTERSSVVVKYKMMIIEINPTEYFNEARFYLAEDYVGDRTYPYSYYNVRVIAHQLELYNYILNMDYSLWNNM